MKMDALPLDVWASVPLRRRDMAALAGTCRHLRDAMTYVACVRGIRVRPATVAQAGTPRWQELRALEVCGTSLRYGGPLEPRIPVPAFGRLVGLTLMHCRLVPGFWPAVFAACPALRHVVTKADFYADSYAEDVHHAADLVTHGAPRLESLDMEGGWMVVSARPALAGQEPSAMAAAARRVGTMPPVASCTLRRYRSACRQVPLAVDAPLDSLAIDEPTDPPPGVAHVVCRMGPRTVAHTRQLTWRHGPAGFDASWLRAFARLRDLDIQVDSVTCAARLGRWLATLAGLPGAVQRLVLRLDTWRMRTYDVDVPWGAPLRHLDGLETLRVEMSFPPATVGDLLCGWLGAAGAVRRVVAEFDEPAAKGYEDAILDLLHEGGGFDTEEIAELRDAAARAAAAVCPAGLHAWLERHPGAVARVTGLGGRLASQHPRVVTSAA